MTADQRFRAIRPSRLLVACLGASAMGAVTLGLGSATAQADVNEVGPGPTVTSRQASEFSVVRINDYGVARGVADTRLASAGVVSAQGEVRDTMKAVVGGRAANFEGGFPTGPGMGDW